MIKQGTIPMMRMTAIASLLVMSAPTMAQVDADCTGSNPGTVTCSQAGVTTYADGIVHATNDGDLTVDVGADVISFGSGGFITTATGDDSTVMTKGDSGSMSNSAASGTTSAVVIGATSENGDIDITTGAGQIRGVNANVTHGIRAESTGGGDINISTGGNVSVSTSSSAPGVAGVEAVTNGGDIDLNIAGTASGPIGIRAATTIGNIVSTDGGSSILATTTSGSIGITKSSGAVTAISESGGISIVRSGGSGDIVAMTSGNIESSGAGTGTITTNTTSGGGSTLIRKTSAVGNVAISSGSGAVAIEVSGGGNPGSINLLTGSGPATISAAGVSTTSPAQIGNIDASAFGGGVSLDLGASSRWTTAGSVFSAGSDLVNIGVEAQFRMPAYSAPTDFGSLSFVTTVLDFGGGDDAFENAGIMMIGNVATTGTLARSRDSRIATLRMEGLDTFRNSGTIYLGAMIFDGSQNTSPTIYGTDLWRNDILSMPGAHFVGEDGRIILDADLNLAGTSTQGGCDTSLRDAGGNLPISDCVDLRGGQASGRTSIDIVDMQSSDRGAYLPEGFVLVDVAGGSADPEAFVVGQGSTNYSPQAGGVIDKGVLVYTIAYDESSQQFKLYGVEGAVSQQFPLISQAANDLWRTSANAWFDRQLDQRDVESHDGRGGGAWLRSASSSADRDSLRTVAAGSRALEFDNSYSRRDSTVTFGVDMLSRNDDGRAWVLGPMIGYARSKVNFDQSNNSANIEGTHYGIYGSMTMGAFYVDAALNRVQASIDNRVPVMDLPESISLLRSDVTSFGGQVEMGWRLATGSFDIEPLASLSYVTSKLEDIKVRNGDPQEFGARAKFDDAKSVRGGLGVRFGINDILPSIVPTALNLTAKVVQESDGESRVTVENFGPDMPVGDTLDGTFSEITAALSITNRAKTAAGYLNIDTVFGDDYESLGFSAGFRLQW